MTEDSDYIKKLDLIAQVISFLLVGVLLYVAYIMYYTNVSAIMCTEYKTPNGYNFIEMERGYYVEFKGQYLSDWLNELIFTSQPVDIFKDTCSAKEVIRWHNTH